MITTIDRLRELNDLLIRKSFSFNYSLVAKHIQQKFDLSSYSERSFSRDMRTLKDQLAERYPDLEQSLGNLIKYAKSTSTYYLVRGDLSAFPSFTETELSQIAQTIEYNRHLFTDGLGGGIISKLQAINLENNLAKYHEELKWPAIQLVKDGERSGEQFFSLFLEKIYAKEVVEIHHKGLKEHSKVKKTLALPLMLKEYNNGWYTGWYLLFYPVNDGEKWVRPNLDELWCFALDRILKVNAVKSNFEVRISSTFNPLDYFKNLIGVYRNDELKSKKFTDELVLLIRPHSWIIPYLEKYPIHHSQRMEQSKEKIYVYLKVEMNQELTNFINQYATEISLIMS